VRNHPRGRVTIRVVARSATLALCASAPADVSPLTVLHQQQQQYCMKPAIGTPGGNVSAAPCHASGLDWEFEPVRGTQAHRERIRNGSFCLGARGRRLVSAPCDDSLEQQWVITPFETPGAPPPPGFRGIQLKSAATGECVEGAPEPVGGARIRLHPECQPHPSQQWNVHRSVFERLLVEAPPEAPRAPRRALLASGQSERLQFYADEGRTLLVGWRGRDCLGAQTSWGVSSPHETRVTAPCPREAGALE
jgi:hypothetical protein